MGEWAGGLMSCDTPLVYYGAYTLHGTGTRTETGTGMYLSLSLYSVQYIPVPVSVLCSVKEPLELLSIASTEMYYFPGATPSSSPISKETL